MAFWRKDRVREHGQHVLRHVRHVRRMREDIMPAAELATLRAHEAALALALGGGGGEALAQATTAAEAWFERHGERRSRQALRENLEILAVALGVAMACRTYFIQPFKIPTGSMQPTLYGIIYEPSTRTTLADRMPLKFLKWSVTGKWHQETRVRESGRLTAFRTVHAEDGSPKIEIRVNSGAGERQYRLPLNAIQQLEAEGIVSRWLPDAGARPNGILITIADASMQNWFVADTEKWLPQGALLWRGDRVAGDHVFVDRVRWNFRPPHRGQIIVFNTDGIPTLPPKTHYIKRLVGLPGETVAIDPPNLLINGEVMTEPFGIRRIAQMRPEYGGFKLVDPGTVSEPRQPVMYRTEDAIKLRENQYLAMGDNTGNSRDGRYWGAVPRQNLVGPAALVYWPFSKRWGIPK